MGGARVAGTWVGGCGWEGMLAGRWLHPVCTKTVKSGGCSTTPDELGSATQRYGGVVCGGVSPGGAWGSVCVGGCGCG